MRRNEHFRCYLLLFICLFLLIAVNYLTDFPKRSVFNLSKSAVECVNNMPATSIQFINKSVIRETINRVTPPFRGGTKEHLTSLKVAPSESKKTIAETTSLKKEESTNKPKTILLDGDEMIHIEKRFKARRERVNEYCHRKTPRQMKKCEADNINQNLKYVEKRNLLYCAIEKSGSTFWKRILLVTAGWSNVSSPHAIKSVDVHNGKNCRVCKPGTCHL